jgi:hypothetical protein
MRRIIFLGPSLGIVEARQRLDALYLPPCAMGDVYAAVERHRPQVIGIIDGYFERTPAVWHKEILYALSRGIAVFGGGSMGALRAAELRAFGMRGVGRIFEQYASGELEDDDEVAVVHLRDDAGYRSLSEPMVNIRYGLELAVAAGVITPAVQAALIEIGKSCYYPQRTWDALLQQAASLPGIETLRQFIEQRRPDRKAEDACAVLDAVKAWTPQPAQSTAEFDFEPTIFWEHLCSYRAEAGDASAGGSSVTREQVVNHLRLTAHGRRDELDRALLLHLAKQEARRMKLVVADDRQALARFRQQRGLQSPKALQEWLAREHVTQEDCLELARDEERLRQLHWRLIEAVNAQLPRVLRAGGRFGATVRALADRWHRLSEQGIHEPSESDVASIDAVLAWYQREYGPIPCALEQYIVELGFGSTRQFVAELVAEYLSHQSADRVSATALG